MHCTDVFLAKFSSGQHVAKFKKLFKPWFYLTSKHLSAQLLLPFFLQCCLPLAYHVLFPRFEFHLSLCSWVFFAGFFVSPQLLNIWSASRLSSGSFFLFVQHCLMGPSHPVVCLLSTTCKPKHCVFFSFLLSSRFTIPALM